MQGFNLLDFEIREYLPLPPHPPSFKALFDQQCETVWWASPSVLSCSSLLFLKQQATREQTCSVRLHSCVLRHRVLCFYFRLLLATATKLCPSLSSPCVQADTLALLLLVHTCSHEDTCMSSALCHPHLSRCRLSRYRKGKKYLRQE